ncbi:LLM class flavin-dependent oxidoreductase [Streptomyces sp. ISL-100]|uniref:LLM class flavin-dependent oxidoreductase n=1 Tax=Streptomyces sp. ISL-100 TaxID=2819173 RepID=UPI001BECA36E|nr:LLM class flavin-dependent oxidoreductase [Streptomyces sp. ISL-100]MBT2395416.1 LLM class flavin-dependent oxidoreductase [Streptomyces sp. ISL-100]
MKLVVFSIGYHLPHPANGVTVPSGTGLEDLVDLAVEVERLGFDAYGIGERHGRPFLAASPAVLLAAVAVRTSGIRLMTTVTVLSAMDPVRAAEDFATLDNLSGGRLELVIGKGNDPGLLSLFGIYDAELWDRLAENYALLRRLWTEQEVHWAGRFRTPLHGATVTPRPFQEHIRIWHGSATSFRSADLAARYGDPLFTANGSQPMEKYRVLVDHYRERWEHYGRAPGDAVVGAGAVFHVARTSQQAREQYRPIYTSLTGTAAARRNQSPFQTLDDAIRHGPLLVGSPQQIIEKVHQAHQAYGNQLLGLTVDGLPPSERRESLELFAADVAPVLRRELPDALSWHRGST